MNTRQNTRQELKDLAKLASTMPRERPPQAAPSRPTLDRPPTPASVSRITVPPAAASIPPASMTLAPEQAKKRGGRAWVLGVSVVLGLTIAVAGGVTLGRTLARRSPPVAAAAVAPAPSPLPAPPAPPPVAVAAPTTTTPVVAATMTPPPSTAVAVATTTPPPKAAPAYAARRAWPKPAAKSSLVANIPAGNGAKDPLEEAIRKAVASTPPSAP